MSEYLFSANPTRGPGLHVPGINNGPGARMHPFFSSYSKQPAPPSEPPVSITNSIASEQSSRTETSALPGSVSGATLDSLCTDMNSVCGENTTDGAAVDESLFTPENEADETSDDSSIPEALPNTLSGQFLSRLLVTIKAEVKALGKPKIYSEGTFWWRSQDPVFALEKSRLSETGLNPRELCERDVFIFLPGLPSRLPGEPEILKCPKCRKNLKRNGMLFELQKKSLLNLYRV